MAAWWALLWAALGILAGAVWALSETPIPDDIYGYMKLRDEIRAAMDQKPSTQPLTDDEQIVDRYLKYMKWVEFERTKAKLPAARPLGEELDTIKSGDIYRVLKKLPKGGNMHSHENHQLSKRTLYDIVWESPDFQYLYIVNATHETKGWKLDFFVNPPTDLPWIKVSESGYTKDQILEKQTLLGILSAEALKYPSDTRMRWRDMNPLWGRGSKQLIYNIAIRRDFLRKLYQTSMDENVQFVETRSSLAISGLLYRLNTSSEFIDTNGKEKVDPTGDLDVQIMKEMIAEFTASNPSFIGHKVITQTSRSSSNERVLHKMNRSIAMYNKYPDVIGGVDLVSEEDSGHSSLYYVETYLSNNILGKIPFYLHTAETSFPMDLLSSDREGDLLPTLENAIDSILLGARRVGHGTGYFKHPYLVNLLKERDIAVEVCPVSSQILGYASDLRNHPVNTYLHQGIPVVLGSDDAGTFGHDEFTVDWYFGFMSWELNLGTLKQLAVNSLNYSSMSNSVKVAAIENKWKPSWWKFIKELKSEACKGNFSAKPKFIDIYPRRGPASNKTRVHIFGRHFESGVCKQMKCRFGTSVSMEVEFISTSHLACQAYPQSSGTYPVALSLDGTNFRSTGQTFTYYEPLSSSSSHIIENSSSVGALLLVSYVLISFT